MKFLRQPVSATAKTMMSLFVISSAMLSTGCAHKEIAPAFTADPAAFEYAVGEAAKMQLYMEGCTAVDSGLTPQTEEAMTVWYQRNWPQVDVADTSYSQKLADQVITYQGAKIALPAIRLRTNIEKDIQLQLDQTRHTHTTILATCSRRIAGYKDGSFDLSVNNKNADLYLKSLVAPGAAPAAPHTAPLLANNLKVSGTPGRSEYTLEKTLLDLKCGQSEILSLRNEWPYETYGAFCPDGKTVFITCEWGECKTH
jgi:hypothetical protein